MMSVITAGAQAPANGELQMPRFQRLELLSRFLEGRTTRKTKPRKPKKQTKIHVRDDLAIIGSIKPHT